MISSWKWSQRGGKFYPVFLLFLYKQKIKMNMKQQQKRFCNFRTHETRGKKRGWAGSIKTTVFSINKSATPLDEIRIFFGSSGVFRMAACFGEVWTRQSEVTFALGYLMNSKFYCSPLDHPPNRCNKTIENGMYHKSEFPVIISQISFMNGS